MTEHRIEIAIALLLLLVLGVTLAAVWHLARAREKERFLRSNRLGPRPWWHKV